MGQHYLKPLFAPKSVAVFGASDQADSVGKIVFHNMLQSGYQGCCTRSTLTTPRFRDIKLMLLSRKYRGQLI